MNRDQFAFTFTKNLKRPPTLENIPEDVAEVIADLIKSWANIDGSLEQREKERKARDSALRAVALSCRRAHRFYSPILLESVTLDFRHFFPFCLALQGHQEYSHLIKSVTFNYIAEVNEEERGIMVSHLDSLSRVGLVSGDPNDPNQFLDNVFQCKAFMFQRLVSLQSSIIQHPIFNPLSLKDLSCFPNSLKRLYLSLADLSSSETDETSLLNAKNVIWLLSFGKLSEVCLGLTISTSDFNFLSEHHQAFERTSNVKKLSLCFLFVSKDSDRKTWWGTSTGTEMELENGNMQKTEALKLLLSSVNQLECLELFPSVGEESKSEDKAMFNLDHLFFNLEESLGSLCHLRLFGYSWSVPLGARIAFPPYLCLKTLSLDRGLLYLLTNQIILKLPSSLERLVLTDYLTSSDGSIDFQEDRHLAQLVRSQTLPNLKEVVVPSAPIGPEGKSYGAEDPREGKKWADRRKQLEDDPIFKSGKVKLRKYSPGEMSE